MATDVTLPEGFVLDQLPEGFKIDPPKSRLDKAVDALRSGLPGGPIGMVSALGQSNLNEFSEMLERGAYKAGGAVSDALAGTVSPEVAGGAGYATNVAIQAVPALAA